MIREIINFWLMILLWIILIQWTITQYMIYRFNFLNKLWTEFTKKYLINDVYLNNWNFYYYYFTWSLEVTKDKFYTDTINYYDKIIFWTSWCTVSNSLKNYIWVWKELNIIWVLNDINALKEFYSKTNLKWLYNMFLPKKEEINVCSN